MIREIRILNDFRKLKDDWNALLDQARYKRLFLRYEWLYSWAYHFCPRDVYIICVLEKGQLIGIAPLFLKENKLTFIGSPDSDYLNFIMKEGKELQVMKEVFDHLLTKVPNAIIDLSDITEGTDLDKYFQTLKNDRRAIAFRIHHDTTYWVPISDDMNINKRLKRSIQTGIKKLSGKGIELKYYCTKDEDNVCRDMDEFFRLHLMRIKESHKLSPAEDPNYREFHKLAARSLLPFLRLEFMAVSGDPASASYSYEFDGRLYCYLTGINPNYYEYSMGNINTKFSVESALKNNIKVYDFLRGAHSYKSLWGAVPSRNMRLVIFRKSLKNIFKVIRNFPELYQVKRELKARFPRIAEKIRKITK